MSGDKNPEVPSLSEQVRVRFEKLARIRERRENPYKNGYEPSALASDLQAKFSSKTKEELEAAAQKFSVAGRVMAIRDFGKASFVRIKDRTAIIQLYVQKDKLGDSYAAFKELDIGDIV